ncbi:unnamed protein product [Rotaria sp. Silwood2]|nr:unnamed protein product [Rotaria sp. Silwood2]
MAIEMIGAVYCPLSPRDPEHRLHGLLEQTESRLIFIHHSTKRKAGNTIKAIDMDSVLIDIDVQTNNDFVSLSSKAIAPDGIAYIIFTSGSTGVPKAPCSVKLFNLLVNIVPDKCRIWDLYGPAEATIGCTLYLADKTANFDDIPIGKAIPNYQYAVFDEFRQEVSNIQDGELYVGGAGVFCGYLRRDDLTARGLCMIDGERFYRTGDLVRLDSKGLLHYRGRKDHQIKLHGQRIELGEIERCLLDTSISACVVIKWDDDHLIAYVQSSDIDEEQLHEYCQSHLPPNMIPSKFVLMEKLPLNVNGKIDRKLLPSPNMFSEALLSTNESSTSHSQLEDIVHNIWCEVLQYIGRDILGTKSFFSLGGHSFLMIKLYHRYQTLFSFDSRILSIGSFLSQPTLLQHVKLLEKLTKNDINLTQWRTLHIIQGTTSFAQERILLDEQVRFTKNVAIYNELDALKVVQGSLSRNRLLTALRSVLTKQTILRTSLVIDNEGGTLKQCITDRHQTFSLATDLTFKNNNELYDIIDQIIIDPNLFDLSSGRSFHCQILRQDSSMRQNEDDEIIPCSDILIVAFHHSVFDRFSSGIFFNELRHAYNNNGIISVDDDSLQYIDYSVYEHQMDMMVSHEFWKSQLQGYNLERRLSLPTDRQRSSNDQRSGVASVAEIHFDDEISRAFLNYASAHQVTPFQLGLATFYTFLFRLTHGDSDICVSGLNANRYKSELENMIGMFVATLPYAIKLNSCWSFDELVKHVRDKCLSILEHSHYPLQYILADFHLNQLNASFLEIVFDFMTSSMNDDHVIFNNGTLEQVAPELSSLVAKVDLTLTFFYKPTVNNDRVSYRFTCSHNLFDESTVETMARRFQHLVFQLFCSKSDVSEIDQAFTPIKKLSLILPDEAQEMQGAVFYRLSTLVNEGMFLYEKHF